jgi:hypothetical protein
MIIQIMRFSSSALLPSAGWGVVVLVVVSCAPDVPSPGTNRLATVVKVIPRVTSSTGSATATSSSSSSGGGASVSGGAVVWVTGGAVVGGAVVVVGLGRVVVVVELEVVVGQRIGGSHSCLGDADVAPGSPRWNATAASMATASSPRRPRARLASVMHSHLPAPSRGDRTHPHSADCWTLHLSS